MDEKHQFFVYEITNESDGSVYVGMTTNPKLRWRAHLERAFHPLTHAMVTHGTGSFAFRVTESYASKDSAELAEELRIKEYLREGKCLYNIEHTSKERRPRLAQNERVSKTFVWNRRLYSSRGRVYAKFKDETGKWRNKYIPTNSSLSLERATSWFESWLEASRESESNLSEW